MDAINTKPSGYKGYLHKLNYFPMISYRRYFVLDPDDGTFARYKVEADFPLSPM